MRVVLALTTTSLTACLLVTPLSRLRDGEPSIGDASSDGVDFEEPASSQCGAPWGPFRSTLTLDPVAHQGTRSCRVCEADGATLAFTIDQPSTMQVKAGQVYRARAWVRVPAGAVAAKSAQISIRIYVGGTAIEASYSAPQALDGTWRAITVAHGTKVDGVLNVYVGFEPGSAGACALVDDVSLELLP
jgi:hypothetical protein